ncbi:sigma factor-like helix-turn-helix DNA-binding protein [Lysobacter changpingensis]|uniref:sigma-70 region 4 domain-containing protein n=1 Tax=Lysobacter changpingensis TaxID=2792784 RepID=UPI001A8DDCB8|nr:sigma-70 region 4 domain-containing protein [Lysobacter changpingensis]
MTVRLLLCTTAFPAKAASRLEERLAQQCQAEFHRAASLSSAHGDAVPMSVPSASPRPSGAPALSAFLRGIERRGAVLAELQAGDATAGDSALADAMRQFRPEAGSLPMAEWPRRFWSLLLAQPRLQHRTAVAIAVEATDRLGELGSGPRAALLLRVAAGLSEEEAAEVLGVGLPSYRLALQRALPHHADGRADPLAWQQLREQIHRRIKTLPPDRLVRLSSARETVLRGETGATAPRADATPASRPRWLMPLLWGLLALCVAGLAATFLPIGSTVDGVGGSRRIEVQPLPEADSPASGFGEETAMITHRDFALLADPQGEAAAQDLEFNSWLAAQQAAGVTAPAPPAAPVDAPADENVAPSPVADGIAGETQAETEDAP